MILVAGVMVNRCERYRIVTVSTGEVTTDFVRRTGGMKTKT